MRIAVIGKGNIGGSLGSKWLAAGHDVVYGARDGARDGSAEGPGGAPVRGIGDALKDADIILLAVPGQVVQDVVNEQAAALAGKTVIDAVNRMGAPETDSRARSGRRRPLGPLRARVQHVGLGELRRPAARREPVLRRRSGGPGRGRGTHPRGRARPAYLGDASATATVDALLPLWFALVKQNGGDRRVALRVVTDR